MYDCEVVARMLGVPFFMGTHEVCYTGGCQNHGPFLDPYCNTAPNIQAAQQRDHNFDNLPICCWWHLPEISSITGVLRWCIDPLNQAPSA